MLKCKIKTEYYFISNGSGSDNVNGDLINFVLQNIVLKWLEYYIMKLTESTIYVQVWKTEKFI